MPSNGNERRKSERLERIRAALLEAREMADDLHAYLLAAKIEDSLICAEDMIDALR